MLYPFTFLCTQFVLPLRDIRRNVRRAQRMSYTHESLRSLLEDAEGFHEFLLFSLRDFTIENPLFYQRYREIAERVKEGELASTQEMHLELKVVYASFIADGAQYQLNLTKGAFRRVEKRIGAGEGSLSVLDEVLQEVFVLMFHNTYPRYLSKVKGGLEEDVNLPVNSATPV
jgi:hypothetical protein